MNIDRIRLALVSMIAAVPDVGRVHPYMRYARLDSDFQALYLWQPPLGGAEHLRGWQVSNTAIQRRTLGVSRVLHRATWTVRGYLALSDELATELVMDNLVEAINDAYEADRSLGGVCTAEQWGDGPDGLQKLEAGPVVFCGVLCNSCRLELETWSYQ